MWILQRIQQLIGEDLATLLPGSGRPFNGAAFLRLFLYLALLIFTISLFLSPVRFTREFISPPGVQPPPPAEHDDVIDPRNI